MSGRTILAMFAASTLLACASTAQRSQTSSSAPSLARAEGVHVQQGAGHPRGDLIPRAALFGNSERTNLMLSPDGKYLSWLAPAAGVLNVWVVETGRALAQARPVTSERQRPVYYYQWTYDGKHLVHVQDRAGNEDFHIYRTNLRTGKTVDLTPFEGARATPIGLSPQQPNMLLATSNDRDPKAFDLFEIEIATGKRRRVLVNDRGFSQYVVDRDLKLRIAARAEKDGSVTYFTYDAKTKTFQEHDRVGADDAKTTRIVGFERRGDSYYVLDSRGRNTRGLYKVDLRTKQRTRVFEDPRADAPDNDWPTRGSLLYHPTAFTIDALLVEYERPRWVMLDARLERDLTGLARLGEGVPSIESRTLDDRHWIVQLKRDAAVARYYLWDRQKQRGRLMFSAQPALEGQPLVPMHPVIIRSRDGLALVSYLSLPRAADANADGCAERASPMVLLVHGGPRSRDRWGFSPQHQLLANRGYATLSVNYRSSTGFGKAFTNAGSNEWGKKMQNDLLDAVTWAVESGVTTADKICIMGRSYGGFAALAGMSMTPEKFVCGVDLVGPSNIVTLLRSSPPYGQSELDTWHHRVGNPNTAEAERALRAVSPLAHAGHIARPLLIGQGESDPRVRKAASEQIVEALNAKHVPVSYVVFPDEGHDLLRPENRVAFNAVTEAFLSVQLGGYYEPVTERELAGTSLSIEQGRELLPGFSFERSASSPRAARP